MQMLLVGGALVARPKLLMLDEPSVGLAPNIAEELCATIAAINREQGLTILLVEQNAHAAMALCDYGNIIESGRIVLHGTAGILGTLSIMRPDDGPPRRLIPANACALVVLDASEREQHQHRRPEEPHHDDCGNGVDEHAPAEAERRSPTNGLIWQP